VPQIVVEGLAKAYQIAERRPGLWGAVRGLARRRYRTVRALDGVSFQIEAGELVGYIGPNGAGKSTTVKVLAGIIVPDAGRCEVRGRVPWKQRLAHVAELGVVFGQRTQLWWDLPVVESFELLRDIYRVPQPRYERARDELIATLELGALLDVPVRQLSLGQRMRCDLAAALLHAPQILFLDEPTIGLDAVSKLAVRDFVKRLNRERGVTVVLTTHDMDDIESLCTRVMVIGAGKILSDGSLAELRARVTRERWLTVDLDDGVAWVDEPEAKVIRREGNRVCLAFDPQQLPPAELIRRITSRHAIRDLFVENPPIELIIARLYAAQAQAQARAAPGAEAAPGADAADQPGAPP
jgi:ABC-2 type transport system ATP-binding protein